MEVGHFDNVFKMDNKIFFKVKGLKGNELYMLLFSYNVRLEKATLNAVVVTVLLTTTKQDIDHLIEVIKVISNNLTEEQK